MGRGQDAWAGLRPEGAGRASAGNSQAGRWSQPEAWCCHPVLTHLPSPRAVFVLEYYLDTLWKGALLFLVCFILVSFGLVSQV